MSGFWYYKCFLFTPGGTSRYFEVILGTFRYFKVLWALLNTLSTSTLLSTPPVMSGGVENWQKSKSFGKIWLWIGIPAFRPSIRHTVSRRTKSRHPTGSQTSNIMKMDMPHQLNMFPGNFPMLNTSVVVQFSSPYHLVLVLLVASSNDLADHLPLWLPHHTGPRKSAAKRDLAD